MSDNNYHDLNASDDVSYPFWLFNKPLVCIILCLAICIYTFLFFINYYEASFGTIERNKDARVFLIFFASTVCILSFCNSKYIKRIKSLWCRILLFFGCAVIAIVCILPAWVYNKYDHEKIEFNARLLPFSNSPSIQHRRTLYFSNIRDVRFHRGGEQSAALTLVLENGRRIGFSWGSIPGRSIYMFLVNLYKECYWLREGIEREFGSIEQAKNRIQSIGRGSFNFNHFAIFVFLIFASCLNVVGVILYIFKGDARLAATKNRSVN